MIYSHVSVSNPGFNSRSFFDVLFTVYLNRFGKAVAPEELSLIESFKDRIASEDCAIDYKLFCSLLQQIDMNVK